MKLWVDDIRIPPNDSWHICRTALSAVRALDMFLMDITDIQLDHDISHQVVMGEMSRPYSCQETFAIVAYYIAAKKYLFPNWNPKIIIHTSNPVGAALMQGILDETGIESKIQLAGGANRLEMML